MGFLKKIKAAEEDKSIIDLLQEALMGEYQQWDMYNTYASRLMGQSYISIKEEFLAHAKEETDHIETVQRWLVGMGAVPTREREVIPEAEGDDVNSFIRLQMDYEQKAVDTYTNILDSYLLTDEALRIDIENILSKEQEHYHDLELFVAVKG